MWNYLPQYLIGSGATSNMMKVRYLVGDTEETRPQLQDEEIYFVLNAQPVVTYAAAAVCDTLAAKYAFLVNTNNSDLRVSAAARHKHYMDLADRLRKLGPGDIPGLHGGSILAEGYAGGVLKDQAQSLTGDSNNNLPPFSIGMDDLPGTK